MARILVSGAKGFIGQHMMKSLSHHEAIGFDVDTVYPEGQIAGPFDGIIHLAAVSRVKDAESDRLKCLETNLMLTARMLEWNPRWFIFASSCEPTTNIYGYSKRAAEDYIKLRTKMYAIFRLSNVYGPGMAEDKLLARIRNGASFHDGVLPFEHVPVSVVVEMMRLTIQKFDETAFKPFTMKLAAGVAKTPKELLDVATSY